MAGLIDFSLLGPGIDLSGATEGYINSLQAATDRKLQKAQLDRQTRLDLRADKQDAARQTAGGQIAAGDLTGAGTTALQSGDTELYSQIRGLSNEHRAEIAAHADIIGSTALALKAVPAEQRAAAFAAAAPALKARGLTEEELSTAGGDLSDQALDGHINSTLTVKDALQKVDNDRKAALERDRFGHTVENDASMRALTARGQDITVRGQDRAAADAAAGRAVTMRGQNLTAARANAGGTGPDGEKLKALPPTAVTGIQNNLTTLRKVDQAITALSKRPTSVGPGTGALGDTFTQFNDPAGVEVRARLGEIAGARIHDLSGAAVSASEAPRFQPYIPSATDRPQVALTKLKAYRAQLADQVREQQGYYSQQNGYRPYQGAREAPATKAAPAAAPTKVIRYDARGNRVG